MRLALPIYLHTIIMLIEKEPEKISTKSELKAQLWLTVAEWFAQRALRSTFNGHVLYDTANS